MQIQGFKGLGPVLSITSDQEKGLKLSWNFNGITVPDFQHYHVFLLLAQSLSEPKLFLSKYYSQLRLGEIIGVCFYRENVVERKIKIAWSEKSGCNSNIINLRKNNLLQQIHSKLIQQVCDTVEKKRGIVILNIFCDSQFSKKEGIGKMVQSLETAVARIRDKGKQYDRIVFNFISECHKYSQLNNNSGFNFFKCEQRAYQFCCSHLLAYIKTIYIKNLTITVQTEQKFHITSCSSNQWLIFDGMEMEKRYFALPKTKFCEIISFYETNKNPQFQINMNIGIKYSFYDGTEMINNKTFQLKVNSSKDTIKNMNATTEMELLTLHEFKKGNFIRTNLLKQESHFIFSRIKELVKKKKKNTVY